MAHALKAPNAPKNFHKPFYSKDEGGMWLVVAKFLMSDPLFLRFVYGQVRMSLNLYQTNVILCSDKFQGPTFTLQGPGPG